MNTVMNKMGELQATHLNLLLLHNMYKPLITGSSQPTNDLLNCGRCRTAFPLEDIARFIQHKSSPCSPPAPGDRQYSPQERPLGSPTISASDQKQRQPSGEDRVSVGTNTCSHPRTEPSSYTCAHCGHNLDSALSLIQHVASKHKLQLCENIVDPSPPGWGSRARGSVWSTNTWPYTPSPGTSHSSTRNVSTS